MMLRLILVLFVVSCIALSSCKKPDEFPIEPAITFKEVVIYQNTQGLDEIIRVNISFTDGDGDIGYKPLGENDAIFDDPTSQYYLNYVATFSLLRNGVWTYTSTSPPIIPLPLPSGGRLPYLTPDGKNKSLKGDIACDIYPPIQATQDTFRLELFIYDRGLHKSNVIMTSEFILNTQ